MPLQLPPRQGESPRRSRFRTQLEKYEKSARFKVVIKPSKIHRWGLYAFLGPVSEDDLWELLDASEQEFQPAILQ